LQGSFIISPNPVATELHLVSQNIADGNYQLTVRSADGQLLFSKHLSIRNRLLNEKINVSSFPSGTLWINIIGKGGNKTFQIVKQ
jgi:hypothetical protein